MRREETEGGTRGWITDTNYSRLYILYADSARLVVRYFNSVFFTL